MNGHIFVSNVNHFLDHETEDSKKPRKQRYIRDYKPFKGLLDSSKALKLHEHINFFYQNQIFQKLFYILPIILLNFFFRENDDT